MHAAELLANLGNFAADQAEFVAAGFDRFCFVGRHVELPGGDAIKLRGDVVQRSQSYAADQGGEQR